MYYCKTRYYVPEWCRWLNTDSPLFLDFNNIQSTNLFSYCGNDPVNNVDPNGNFWIALLAGMAIGALIGFGTTAYSDYKDDGIWFNGKWQDYVFETCFGAITGAISGGIGSFFSTSNFIAGFILNAFIGAGSQIVSDYYYGNISINSQWYEWVISGLKGFTVSSISYTLAFGVTKYMASKRFTEIIGKYTSNNKINRALNSVGIKNKIGQVGEKVIVKEIMNGDALGVFNTIFSGWLDFAIGVIF